MKKMLFPTPDNIQSYVDQFNNGNATGIVERAVIKLFTQYPKNSCLEDIFLKVSFVNSIGKHPQKCRVLHSRQNSQQTIHIYTCTVSTPHGPKVDTKPFWTLSGHFLDTSIFVQCPLLEWTCTLFAAQKWTRISQWYYTRGPFCPVCVHFVHTSYVLPLIKMGKTLSRA